LLAGYLNLKKPLPDSLKHNTFLHALKSNREALLYYRFAKIIEPAVKPEDEWTSDIIDTAYLLKNAAYALKQAGAAKSNFIKIRYYYQAQRLYYYTGNTKLSMDIYEKYIVKAKPGYYIAGLARGLRAGKELRWGDPAKAAYLFSRQFADFPERRIQAYQNYVDIKAAEKDVLAFTRNANEKAVIYAMNGFYIPIFSTKYLRKVYNTAPASPFVELLLTREINKLEAAYVTPKLTGKLPYDNLDRDYFGFDDSLKKTKNIGRYINELEGLCTQIAGEHKCKNPAFELIAKAYLEWMAAENKAATAQLGQINDAELTSSLYDQKQMVKLLLIAQRIKKLDSASEQEMVPSLKWLDQKVAQESKNKGELIRGYHDFDDEYRLKRFTWSARDFYQELLVPLYLAQHDTTKAALAMLQGMPDLKGDTLRCYHSNNWGDDYTTVNFWQYYLHSSSLRKIVSYKHKVTDDPYLQLLTSGLKRTSYDCLYNLLGTAYLREHNYKEAISALSRIKKHSANDFPSDGYDAGVLKSNPFLPRLRDYPKLYLSSKSKNGYSKLHFAKKMYQLQLAIKRNPQKAPQYYFLMATGLYNTSYYGNAWFMIAYTWTDFEGQNPVKLYYDTDLHLTSGAENLFLKARQLSNDPEFKARCTFMAAKCKQNRYKGYDNEYWNYEFNDKHTDDFRNGIRSNEYFKQLHKSYSATHFYKIAVSECSYFRDFLASVETKHIKGKQ